MIMIMIESVVMYALITYKSRLTVHKYANMS